MWCRMPEHNFYKIRETRSPYPSAHNEQMLFIYAVVATGIATTHIHWTGWNMCSDRREDRKNIIILAEMEQWYLYQDVVGVRL